MALTIEDYEAVAPTVMDTGDFTLTAVENKLAAVPDAPEAPTAPTITKAKVVSIFNEVFTYYCPKAYFEATGKSCGALALDHSLWPSQVKLIIKELTAMKALYDGKCETCGNNPCTCEPE
jgi:hypothetical protein